MLFKSIFFSAAVASLVSARIEYLYAPDTVKAGDNVTVYLGSQGYIQSVTDLSATYGWSTSTNGVNGLGEIISGYYLGPSKSNLGAKNISQIVHIPKDAKKGSTMGLNALLVSLYGVGNSVESANAAIAVKIGSKTSKSYSGVNFVSAD